MIQKPPIDVLVAQSGGKYALSCIIAKRAREILDQPHTATHYSERYKPISAAAYEMADGRLKSVAD